MSDLFSIGAAGLKVYQTALSTTAENIANAGTTGYSRRSVNVDEIGRANSIQLGQSIKLTGAGSYVTGVARASDQYRVAEVRVAQSDLARTETGVVWLERVESALTGNQLGDRLTAFFNAAKGVAADPAASAPRAVMLEQAASLANGFAATGKALDAGIADLTGAGQDAATKLTDLAQQLVVVNRGLVKSEQGSVANAQMLDQRDRLLDGMSALVDLAVDYDHFGRATVKAGGASGPEIAGVESSSGISFAINSSGDASFVARSFGGISTIPARGGTLAGITDGAARIAAAREQLDTLAGDFVTQVNALQTSGRDLDGAAGQPMFTPGTPPTEMTLAISDPRKIAAAAATEGTRGNAVMLGYEAVRSSGGYETSLDGVITGNAAALSARRDVASAQGSIRDAAVTAAQGVSGVDMDEEAVDLVRFQQAYQASSRVIQVARDILQTIIDIR
jgi:flagellar hook-associated protein 1 FlgK